MKKLSNLFFIVSWIKQLFFKINDRELHRQLLHFSTVIDYYLLLLFFLCVFLIYGLGVNLSEGFYALILPVVCYSNADLQKDKIINENKRKSGVYC